MSVFAKIGLEIEYYLCLLLLMLPIDLEGLPKSLLEQQIMGHTFLMKNKMKLPELAERQYSQVGKQVVFFLVFLVVLATWTRIVESIKR